MRFFCMINGTPRNVPNMKFHVDGLECTLVGTWHNGKPYEPNREQFRAALPQRWRKAFDRECKGLVFWHETGVGKNYSPQCHVSLSDARGRYLTTIYCQPVKES